MNSVLSEIRREAIADARFVDQEARASRIGLDLLSELVHENTQIMGLLDIRRSPDFLEDLPVGHDLAGILDKNRQ